MAEEEPESWENSSSSSEEEQDEEEAKSVGEEKGEEEGEEYEFQPQEYQFQSLEEKSPTQPQEDPFRFSTRLEKGTLTLNLRVKSWRKVSSSRITEALRKLQKNEEITYYGTYELFQDLQLAQKDLLRTKNHFENYLRPLLPEHLPEDLDKFVKILALFRQQIGNLQLAIFGKPDQALPLPQATESNSDTGITDISYDGTDSQDSDCTYSEGHSIKKSSSYPSLTYIKSTNSFL